MSELCELTAVEITRDWAKVWTTANEPGQVPREIRAPSDKSRHEHRREAQHHHGHDTDHPNTAFFESITASLGESADILLIGHGKGKANEMVHLTQFWERKHPEVATKVVGAIDSNLEALSDNEVLVLVREWFEGQREFL
jgi:hypothetical protein